MSGNVPLYICTTTSLSIHLCSGMVGRKAQKGGDIDIIMTGLHWCILQHCKAVILQWRKKHSLLSLLDTISTQHRLVKVGEKGNGPFQGKVSAGGTVSDLATSESLTGRSGELPSAPSGPPAASLWNHSQQRGVCSSSQEPSGGWILFNLFFHCLCSPLERDFFPPALYAQVPSMWVLSSWAITRNRFLGPADTLIAAKGLSYCLQFSILLLLHYSLLSIFLTCLQNQFLIYI